MTIDKRLVFSVAIWVASTASQAQQLKFLEGHAGPVVSTAYTPNGKLIVSGGADGTVRLWDRVTGQLVATIADHQGAVLSLAVARDGTKFASAGMDHKAHVYDLPNPDPLVSFAALAGDPVALAASADGKLVVSGDKANLVRLWNID